MKMVSESCSSDKWRHFEGDCFKTGELKNRDFAAGNRGNPLYFP